MKKQNHKGEIIIITSIIWIVIILALSVLHYAPQENKAFNKGVNMGRDWVEKDILYSNSFSFLNNLTCTNIPCPCNGNYCNYCYTVNCTSGSPSGAD